MACAGRAGARCHDIIPLEATVGPCGRTEDSRMRSAPPRAGALKRLSGAVWAEDALPN